MQRYLRLSVVYILILVLFILSIVSLSTPLHDGLKIPFCLMAIFYWSIHRPTLIPPVFIFTIGLLIDVMGYYPIGLNALIFSLIGWGIKDQRRFLQDQNFILVWGILSIVIVAMLVMYWGVFSLSRMYIMSVETIITTFLVSVLVFPIVHFLLSRCHALLPLQNRKKRFKS